MFRVCAFEDKADAFEGLSEFCPQFAGRKVLDPNLGLDGVLSELGEAERSGVIVKATRGSLVCTSSLFLTGQRLRGGWRSKA